VNHNIRRPGAEGQRACKNQPDYSLENHNTVSFSYYENHPRGRPATTLFFA
jgi:hypothetical protein